MTATRVILLVYDVELIFYKFKKSFKVYQCNERKYGKNIENIYLHNRIEDFSIKGKFRLSENLVD
jgi:hypothetical protein